MQSVLMHRFKSSKPVLLRVAVGSLVLLAVAAVLVLRDDYALTVKPDPARAGDYIRLRTDVPEEWSRGLGTRMESREDGRWRPALDLAPRRGTTPPSSIPAKGDQAGGLLKAYRARGTEVLLLPEDLPPGRYRLRQRLIKPGPVKRDIYVEFDVR
jgi:hypothetical protein